MATGRIESGRVNIAGPGNMPMQRVGIQEVQPIAARVEAQGAGQLAEALDRMSANLFQEAMVSRQREGLQFAAQNPLTVEQIEAAKNGDLSKLDLGSNPVSVFQQAVRKARSLELSSQFEAEGRSELVKILNQVELGQATSEQVQAKINTMIDGMGKSLSQIDPEASYKFRATMSTHGSTVLKSALDSELKRALNQRRIKFDFNFDNEVMLLENAASTDPENFAAYADVFRVNIGREAIASNNPEIQSQYSAKVLKALTDARVNALTKALLTEDNLRNPREAIAKLRKGEIGEAGKLRPHVEYLLKNDFASLMRVEEDFMKAATARKNAIELGFVDSNQQGENILARMYATNDARLQRQLWDQLTSLPVSSETIKKARDFMQSDSATGPANDDLAAFARLSQRVALGTAQASDIINAPLTRTTKRQLLQQLSNPNDDISYGVRMIGMAVGIQAENLPPELKDADARQMATATRNTLVTELYTYSRTPLNARGDLPSASDIRMYGEALAKRAGAGMSKAFTKAAESNQAQAVLSVPELRDVDLSNDAAVEAAIATAVKRKVSPTVINSARAAINDYRNNKSKIVKPAGE